MDLITGELVAVATYNACQQIQEDPALVPRWTDVALVIGTAAVENGFQPSAVGAGLGVFGIPIGKALGVYKSFESSGRFYGYWFHSKENKSAKQMWRMFSKAWLGISNVPSVELSKRDLRYLLTHDIRFGAAMCRWCYLGYPEDDPEGLPDVARMWDDFYRTNPEQSAKDFLEAWTENDCMELMHLVGYK